MANQYKIHKSLAGQEDILYGEGKVSQERSGGTYPISKVRAIYPVNSLAELEALDSDKFPKAALYENNSIKYYVYNTTTSQYEVVTSSSSLYVGELPPTNPAQGDKWKRCTDLKEFTYYVDQDGGQWVEDRPSYAVGGAVDSVNGKVGVVTLGTDDISDSSATNKYTSAADIAKLSGIENNATSNSTDATLLDRANHTGTQTASTISNFESTVSANTAVSANTDKVSFPEAPSDGKQYARKDAGWEEVAGGGGGSIFTVTTFTGGGEMVLSAVNEIQDGNTGYTLPSANSGQANEYLIITQALEFVSFEPVVTVGNAATETIITDTGTDTAVSFDQSSSKDIRLTTDGVSQWRLTV